MADYDHLASRKWTSALAYQMKEEMDPREVLTNKPADVSNSVQARCTRQSLLPLPKYQLKKTLDPEELLMRLVECVELSDLVVAEAYEIRPVHPRQNGNIKKLRHLARELHAVNNAAG